MNTEDWEFGEDENNVEHSDFCCNQVTRRDRQFDLNMGRRKRSKMNKLKNTLDMAQQGEKMTKKICCSKIS